MQQLRDRMIATNPRRYFLLKNAYKHGFIHELLDPNHCAIGVTICKNSSSELVISGLPTQFHTNLEKKKTFNTQEMRRIKPVENVILIITEFDACEDQIQR